MPQTAEQKKQYQREWYAKNREREREKQRAYLAAHREENKVRCRARYASDPDRSKAACKAYRKTDAGRAARRREKKRRRERHPERVKAEDKRQRERHRETRIAYMAEYNEKHADRLRPLMRSAYYANHEARLQYNATWRQANPGYDRLWRQQNPDAAKAIIVKKNQKRRAVKKGAAVGQDAKATLARIRSIKSPDVMPCHWCGTDTTKDKRHVDHIIPISRGGPHAADNLCCACPRCNYRKRNKMPEEFRAVLTSRP